MKLNVIITGVTGMVGEGVLHECIHHDAVASILILSRKPSGMSHPKIKEIIHSDFFDLSAIEGQLSGYNACFFCLGVSSIGMKEPEYFKLSHTLTLHVATTLSKYNPEMVFSYISGAGTDSTEQGKSMWARVKGKTENDLMKLPFKKVYAFRPGMLHPTPGLKNTLSYYKYFGWLYYIIRPLAPGMASTLKELGLAMINAALIGYEKPILEVRDIVALSQKTA